MSGERKPEKLETSINAQGVAPRPTRPPEAKTSAPKPPPPPPKRET